MINKQQKIFLTIILLISLYSLYQYNNISKAKNINNNSLNIIEADSNSSYKLGTITDSISIDDLSTELLNIDNEINNNDNKIIELENNISNINVQINDYMIALHQTKTINIFNSTNIFNIFKVYDNYITKNNKIKDIETNINENNNSLKNIEKEISSIKQKNNILTQKESELKNLINELSHNDFSVINEISDNIDNENIESLKKDKIDSFISTHPNISLDNNNLNNNSQLPNFIMPVNGIITSNFGYRIHPISGKSTFHSGIDIGVDTGTPIKASNYGLVIFSGWYNGFGNTVVLSHANGIYTLYGHNSKLLVSVGDRVNQGQSIALAGSTGYSTGPHCHFSLWINNGLVNPLDNVVTN